MTTLILVGVWVSLSLISDIKSHQMKQSYVKMVRKELEYRSVLTKNFLVLYDNLVVSVPIEGQVYQGQSIIIIYTLAWFYTCTYKSK